VWRRGGEAYLAAVAAARVKGRIPVDGWQTDCHMKGDEEKAKTWGEWGGGW